MSREIPLALLCLALASETAAGQTTTLASVNSDSESIQSSISADGRFVAFSSFGSTLVPGDTNNAYDIFLYDRQTAAVTRESVSSAGAQSDGWSRWPSISADGRFVAFDSSADNLVPGDTNNNYDVFVRDRLSGTTNRVSVSSTGAQGNGESSFPSISADGRYVTFRSSADNLVGGDTNAMMDVFVRDLQTGTTTRVSLSSAGLQANNVSLQSAISGDGRFVAFESYASNLVAGDSNGFLDVFVRDRLTGTTTRASVSSLGAQANDDCWNPSISADGRFVGFWGGASTLVPGDTNAAEDAFVHDMQLGGTTRVSVATGGGQANGGSARPVLSADGRYVVFQSIASNLVAGDTNGLVDIFLHDRLTVTTQRVSVSSAGGQSNGQSQMPWVSANGRFVVFDSGASNLAAGDTNSIEDVFVRDVDMPIAAFCDPGLAGVSACPCGNAPSLPGRGCNNSLGTGGVAIDGQGNPSLAADSLVIRASGIGSSGASCSAVVTNLTGILLQGNAVNPSGAAFNDGVRCLAGSLKRIETAVSVSGTWTSTLGVSARSALLGDPIAPGSTRSYGLWYRDPCGAFACTATSNISNGLAVRWSP